MQLIESIRWENGGYCNLALHQKRVNAAFEKYIPDTKPIDLNKVLPKVSSNKTCKVRCIYNVNEPDLPHIEVSEYFPKSIHSLEIIPSESFDYSMKYADRKPIDELVNMTQCDDIIISMDNQITDGSYFNLAFWDGKDWYTPKHYLLNGVMRQHLLWEGKLIEALISVNEIGAFEKVSLINAMLDLGQVTIPTSQVLKR